MKLHQENSKLLYGMAGFLALTFFVGLVTSTFLVEDQSERIGNCNRFHVHVHCALPIDFVRLRRPLVHLRPPGQRARLHLLVNRE